jgi:hypothetical protein
MIPDETFELEGELDNLTVPGLRAEAEAEAEPDAAKAHAAPAAPPGQPVIVIQYRDRGVPWYLAVPLLGLIAFGSVTAYHRYVTRQLREASARTLEDLLTSNPAEARKPGAGGASDAPKDGPAYAPLALNSQPILPEATKPDANAAPAPAPAPPAAKAEPVGPPIAGKGEPPAVAKAGPAPAGPKKEAAPAPEAVAIAPKPEVVPPRPQPARPPLAVGFSVPGDEEFLVPSPEGGSPERTADATAQPGAVPAPPPPAAPAAPGPQPPVSRQELLDSLRAEAAARKAQLDQLRDLKAQARASLSVESQMRMEDARVSFRRELTQIVKSKSSTAGQEIDALCDRYGRDYDDALRDQIGRQLARLNGRSGVQGKVQLLRRCGVPEPGILDYLAHELDRHYLHSRGGPSSHDDVRLMAARQLLLIRLPKDATGDGSPASATLSRPGNIPGLRAQ